MSKQSIHLVLLKKMKIRSNLHFQDLTVLKAVKYNNSSLKENLLEVLALPELYIAITSDLWTTKVTESYQHLQLILL